MPRLRAGLTALVMMVVAVATLGLTSGPATAGHVVRHSTRCAGDRVHYCAFLYGFRMNGHVEIRAEGFIKDKAGGPNYDVLVDQVHLYRKYDHDGDGDREFWPWRNSNPTDRWAATSQTHMTRGTRYHGEYRAHVRIAFQPHGTAHHITTAWLWSNIRYFG